METGERSSRAKASRNWPRHEAAERAMESTLRSREEVTESTRAARWSSLLIVTVHTCRSSLPSPSDENLTPPVGSVSRTMKSSSRSYRPSSRMPTLMVCSTTPGAKVSVPDAAWKSDGEQAEPSLVAHEHPTVPSEPLTRLTERMTHASDSITSAVDLSKSSSPGPSSFSIVTSQTPPVVPILQPSEGSERTTWKTSSSSTSSSSKSLTVMCATFCPMPHVTRPSDISKSSPAVAVTPTVL
mmetsp:Transcript_10259/g.26573  ORF Transcript_10259/g.26573 Transcript_10259/m.26573 type:complete len:241 (+) Transcript_10259:201-923(+)